MPSKQLLARLCGQLGLVAAVAAVALLPSGLRAQTIAEVTTPPLPAGLNAHALTLAQTRQYSASRNFEVVGHSYLKIPQLTEWAQRSGLGAGFNTVHVEDGLAFLAGYNSPPTTFGTVIVDVNDPTDMKVLSFIPCEVGTRCSHLRYNGKKKVLIVGNDPNDENPSQPPRGVRPNTGWAFFDVSDPRRPRKTGFVPSLGRGDTHGMEADDRYVYGCGIFADDISREGMQIIDYSDPSRPRQVATWAPPGHHQGQTYLPGDRQGADGKQQIIQCHEIIHHDDRLYVAWRDAGFMILDVKDRTQPKLLATYDYSAPYKGGNLGAAHTALPVITGKGPPQLIVATDEIFTCPPGFGRILDISDVYADEVVRGVRPANIQLLSTFRAPFLSDRYDHAKGAFECTPPEWQNTIHLPMMDRRSPSLVHVTWYNQGLRTFDISNPYIPVEVGHYVSPAYPTPGGFVTATGRTGGPRYGRATREIYQDPKTNLIYITDGSGGGLTVLRYTGAIPSNPPIPGAR